MTEDVYTNTINELQQDRMRLKGKDLMTRLNRLHKDGGAFDQLTNMFKEDINRNVDEDDDNMTIKLNRKQQLIMEDAVTSAETLKFRVKKQMA